MVVRSTVRFLLALLLFCLDPSLLAAVTLTIRGEIEDVSDALVVVRTKTAVYRIKRGALPPAEKEALKEKGKEVSVSIPSDAVEQVTPKEK